MNYGSALGLSHPVVTLKIYAHVQYKIHISFEIHISFVSLLAIAFKQANGFVISLFLYTGCMCCIGIRSTVMSELKPSYTWRHAIFCMVIRFSDFKLLFVFQTAFCIRIFLQTAHSFVRIRLVG